MHPAPRHRPTLLAATIAAALLGLAHDAATAQNGPAATPATATDAVRSYDIAPGLLGQTLVTIGQQSGRTLSVDPALVAGLQAPAVRGSYTAEQAANAALAGSGLALTRNANGVWSVVRRTAPAAQPGDGTGATRTLHEVTVTAQSEASTTTEGTGSYTTPATAVATGLALSLRDTPQSVTVLTRQQMDDANVETIADALKNVTGITSASSPADNRAYYYSRGFWITRMQYDGMTTAANSTTGEQGDNMASDMVLYDRVEVVRGSTGLLTGSGEPSASINMVRKRANSRTFTGSASLGLGSWNNRRGMVDVSTPLVEDGRIRGRIVAMAQDKDSFINLRGDKGQALYAVVDADLTSSTTLSIGADHQHARQRSPSWGGLPLLFSDGTLTDWDRSKTNSADWSFRDTTNRSVFIDLNHQFDNGWKFKASAAQRNTDSEAKLVAVGGNLDRSTGAGLSANYPYHSLADSRQNIVSVQATGPFDLLGRRHEAVVGWTGSRYRSNLISDVKGSTPISNFYTYNGETPAPNWTMVDWGEDSTNESGIYGALRLSLRDDLKLILGGRQSSWKSTPREQSTRSFDQFTPYAGIVFDLDSRHSLYASYADIFQPQSYRDVTGAYLDPETGYTQEVGIKGEYFGGRLNASLAAFTSQKDNVATRDGLNVVAGTSDWAYIGEKGVKSRGFEAQIAGEILPGWNASASFARTLTQKQNGSRVSAFLPNSIVHLQSTYRLSGSLRPWTIGGGLNWQSGTYSNSTVQAQTVTVEQKPYAVANLMVRYAITSTLSAQLNINNLFDKKYWALLDGTGYYGAPRNAMLSVNYKF